MLQSKIQHSKVVFPDRRHYQIEYSDEFVDIVLKLLKKDRTQRLGAKGDAGEILAHPWFEDIDVKRLLYFEVKPPFIPNTDIGNETKYYDANPNLEDTILPREALVKIN